MSDEPDLLPMADAVESLVKTMICALVDKEDEVRVKAWANERRVCVTVHVADSDMGLVLGPNGEYADNVRQIARIFCTKKHYRFELDIFRIRPVSGT